MSHVTPSAISLFEYLESMINFNKMQDWNHAEKLIDKTVVTDSMAIEFLQGCLKLRSTCII